MADPSLWSQLPLIADGDLRGALAGGAAAHEPPEALNLSETEAVHAAHQRYREAGALVHRTNTRHANRLELAGHDLADRGEAVNNSGSALVRSVIGTAGAMMGSVGPVRPPRGGPAAPVPERERAYGEQLVYLSDTGVDLFVLEHFRALAEALLVVRIARRVSDAFPLALLTFDARGRTAEGVAAGEAARRLMDAGAGAVGVSCAPGGALLEQLVGEMRAVSGPVGVLLGAAAAAEGAGTPAAPERFAAALGALGTHRASILGGCCGTTPQHIAALARRFNRRPAAGL